MLIPSIDLMKAKVVQLEQGRKKKLEIDEPPLEFARRFAKCKEVQVIDLDAAMGTGSNLQIVKEMCRIVNARVGGGIRTAEMAKELVEAGAKKVIIGTMANREFLENLAGQIGKEKIIVAIDSRGGRVVVEGWKKATAKSPFEMAKELEPCCSEFLFTSVEREGLMKGVDFEAVKKLKNITSNKLSIAGGISSDKEARELEKLGVNCILGMALYTGKIKIRGVQIGKC